MNAFIAMENYIVKNEKPFGVGVPVTLNEDVAKFESSRKKNVQSFNNWFSITVPAENFYFDVSLPVREQSDDILAALQKKEFLTTLFVSETKKLASSMDSLVKESSSNEEKLSESNRIFSNFLKEKYAFLLDFQSGQELFDFINTKCRTHDRGISSALLYSSGIKGVSFSDELGKRFFLYNAKKDIKLADIFSEQLENTKLNL